MIVVNAKRFSHLSSSLRQGGGILTSYPSSRRCAISLMGSTCDGEFHCGQLISKAMVARSNHNFSVKTESMPKLSIHSVANAKNNSKKFEEFSAIFGTALLGLFTCSSIAACERTKDSVYAQPSPSDEAEPIDIDDLPEYTKEQVGMNNGKNGKPIWMSYGGVVYDVTGFIANHPGGSERILQAAGSAIEPFWNVYRQHFSTDVPMKLMEKMAIGRLKASDQEAIDEKMEKSLEKNDPYANEPVRHSALIVHSEQPMNAEVPAKILTQSYITPNELFYIRHHHPVPQILHVADYQLKIDVFEKTLNLSLKDIQRLPKLEVTTTLQCSGNRRGDMNSVNRTSGTSWGQGAISTAKWGGARLRDVLKLAGLDDALAAEESGFEHVRFESLDGMKASIPLSKAYNIYGDCILAYEMNGEPIPAEHGFPVRVIVPGFSAVRNVKWISKIELSKEDAEGAWQRGLNYKTLPPSVRDASQVNLDEMPSMTESSLFSGITEMKPEVKGPVQAGDEVMIKAKGWAWAGGGRNIVRVDLTGNNGKNWSTARITDGGNQKYGRAWAWVFWECDVPATIKSDGSVEVMSKSVDMAFNVQPENVAHTWNVRGLGNNSWYRKMLKIPNFKMSSQ